MSNTSELLCLSTSVRKASVRSEPICSVPSEKFSL